MFFEFRVNGEVLLLNLAQVTRIQVTPPADDKSVVTFFFTDGRQESVPMSPSTVQKLYQAVPRPAIYGSGGMG